MSRMGKIDALGESGFATRLSCCPRWWSWMSDRYWVVHLVYSWTLIPQKLLGCSYTAFLRLEPAF
jgi:hypothetical protein